MRARVFIIPAFASMIIIIEVLGRRRTRSFSEYSLGAGEFGILVSPISAPVPSLIISANRDVILT